MAFEKTPRKIRQLAYEELVIRYGADIPFETDMPVTQQQIKKLGSGVSIDLLRTPTVYSCSYPTGFLKIATSRV